MMPTTPVDPVKPSAMTLGEHDLATANDHIGTQLVLDTEGMRVWHLRLKPGEALAVHRHDRPYFWTVLTDGRARSRYGNGDIVDIAYRAGETRHFGDLTTESAFVHDLTNTGETELVFVTVEFDPRRPSVQMMFE